MNLFYLLTITALFLIASVGAEEQKVLFEVVLEDALGENLSELPRLNISTRELVPSSALQLPPISEDSQSKIGFAFIDKPIEGALGCDLKELPQLELKHQDAGRLFKASQASEEPVSQANTVQSIIAQKSVEKKKINFPSIVIGGLIVGALAFLRKTWMARM